MFANNSEDLALLLNNYKKNIRKQIILLIRVFMVYLYTFMRSVGKHPPVERYKKLFKKMYNLYNLFWPQLAFSMGVAC